MRADESNSEKARRLRAEIVEKTPVTLALKAGFTISTELTETAAART